MKRALLFTLTSLFCITMLRAQTPYLDSLRNEIRQSSDDTVRLVWTFIISYQFSESNPDSSMYYAQDAVTLSEKLNYKLSKAIALGVLGYAQMNKGLYPRALQSNLSALALANDPDAEKNVLPKKFILLFVSHRVPNANHFRVATLGFLYEVLGILYENTSEFSKELEALRKARYYTEQMNDPTATSQIYYIMGRALLIQNEPDSGLFYEKKAHDLLAGTQNDDASGIFLQWANVILLWANLLKQGITLEKHWSIVFYIHILAAKSQQHFYWGIFAFRKAKKIPHSILKRGIIPGAKIECT